MEDRDLIEKWALILFDHFNPHSEVAIMVGKSDCIRMAEAALRRLKAKAPESK
jgi:hypothetical protein